MASAEIDGDRRTIPLTVIVMDSSLVLQGETPDGVLTLVLDGQNEGGERRPTTGRWTLGRTEGVLHARMPR